VISARESGVAIILAMATAFGLYSGGQPQEPFRPHWIAEAAAQTPEDPQTLGSPAASGPKASEPNLAPLTLTPQRMQSIGVKIGIVGRRKVRDEIRTVGNVEADETRLADVQVRVSGWVQKVYADA
jgi:multidrug efflux pump subunit AcrA (membrane-fusion protein)